MIAAGRPPATAHALHRLTWWRIGRWHSLHVRAVPAVGWQLLHIPHWPAQEAT